jgi:tRNA threonylcarbamoyladenosine biosynthesis protein TsaE
MTDARHTQVFETRDVAETLALGERLGRDLQPGLVVALIGTLGSGKTHLVKGVSRGNAVPDDVTVNSPTFVLVNEYPGRVYIHHIDAYRLHGARELEALGFDEMAADGGAVFVEWADRVPESMPENHVRIDIQITGDTHRRITITGWPRILDPRPSATVQ